MSIDQTRSSARICLVRHQAYKRSIEGVTTLSETYPIENPTEATTASMTPGVGTIVDGILDIAASAASAQANGVKLVADLAEMDYHAAAAGFNAFLNDMDGAQAQNAAHKESRTAAWDDIHAIGDDIGI